MKRDTTRISGSHAQTWTEMLQHSRDAVLETPLGFEHVIADMREAMASGNPRRLTVLFNAGRNFRRSLDP